MTFAPIWRIPNSERIVKPRPSKVPRTRLSPCAQDKAFALDAYDKAKSRLTQIDQLMAKINDTPDPKAIAELQGRIAAEQAMIQNEQTKLQMYQMVASAEDRLQEQRQREINAKVLSNREYTKHQPFNLLDK